MSPEWGARELAGAVVEPFWEGMRGLEGEEGMVEWAGE
jgi:hypothetical protein